MSVSRNKINRVSRPLLVSIGAVTLLLSACSSPAGTGDDANASGKDLCEGGDTAALIKKVDGLSPEEREKTLLDEAEKAGGAVDWYTEINDPDIILDPFGDKYDDVDVNVYRAGSEQIRQRVLEESDARFSGADLIEMDSLEMAILDTEHLLAPVSSPYVDKVSEAARFDNYLGDRLSYIVPAWNSDKVKAADVPTSLEGYADFGGSLALEGSDVFWFAGQVMNMEKEGKSRDEAVQVFKDLASNASITDGHTTTTELIVAGQYGLAPNNFIHRLLELQDKGAPLEWRPVNIPVVAEVTATAVHCLSDNPAAALLLQDFILSDEGQQAFIDDDRTPAISDLAQESLGGEDIEPITVDVAQVAKDYDTWSEIWDGVVRSAKK